MHRLAWLFLVVLHTYVRHLMLRAMPIKLGILSLNLNNILSIHISPVATGYIR